MERLALRFSIADIPVVVHITFWLLPFWLSGLRLDRQFVMAVPIAFGAVLVHELGHASVARHYGAQPSIDLVVFGGLTHYTLDRDLGRSRTAAIIAAGPLVGAIPGVLVLGYIAGNGWPASDVADDALAMIVWMSVGLSLLNLLPIVPLDGGQLVATVMPGDDLEKRLWWAKIVTLVFGVAVLAWLVLIGARSRLILGGVVLLLFFFGRVIGQRNEMIRRAGRDDIAALARQQFDPRHETEATKELVAIAADSGVDDDTRILATQLVASRSIVRGDAATARRWQRSLEDAQDPVFELAAVVIETGGDQGVGELVEAFQKLPTYGYANRHLLGALLAVGRAEDAYANLTLAYTVSADGLRVADSASVAAMAGAPRLAVALGEYGLSEVALSPGRVVDLAAQLTLAGWPDEAGVLVERLVGHHGVDPSVFRADPRFATLHR